LIFFYFGDSLRKATDIHQLKFTDKKSHFPFPLDNKLSPDYSELIIISDANWTNTTSPFETLSEKAIYYLNLPAPEAQSYIRLTIPGHESVLNDSSKFKIGLEGRKGSDQSVILTVSENNTLITKQLIPLDTGYFNKEIEVDLPKSIAGKHLFRIDASIPAESLRTMSHQVVYTIKKNFRYFIQSAKPTLDKRFLTLSLKRHTEFVQVPNLKAKDIDVLFLSEWNDSTESYLKLLKNEAVTVLAGCLPCTDPVNQNTRDAFFVRKAQQQFGSFEKLDLSKLPPPATVMHCKQIIQKIPLLSLSVPEKGLEDTIDIIYFSKHKQNTILTLAVKDFWKWDFLPMSNTYSEEDAFGFSELLLATIKERLQYNISSQFHSFPAKTLTESDSLPFLLSIPPSIEILSPITTEVLLFNNSSKKVFDTSLTIHHNGAKFQKITLKTIPAGIYSYRVNITAKQKRFTYSDTLIVEKNHTELLIAGQNKVLLKEIGQSLAFGDSIEIERFLGDGTHKKTRIIKDSFKISRNWILLIAIFIILTIEFIYRRTKDLD
jgi:uncharacterized protein YbcV (DUF1398 family)